MINLYKRNHSRLNIASRNQNALEGMLSRNVIFYRILDKDRNHVGNLGYQCARRMISYLQIDYPYRRRGYALAAELAGERAVALKGVSHQFVA